MRAIAALFFIILASFGAPETVAFYAKDSVIHAFLDSYLPFLIRSLMDGPFLDLEVPAAGTMIRLQGLTITEMRASPRNIHVSSQNGLLKIEITDFATNANTRFQMLGGLGSAGRIQVYHRGGKITLNLALTLDESNKVNLTTHSCEVRLSQFHYEFSGGVMAGMIDFFSAIFARSSIRGGVEYGVAQAITTFMDGTGREFIRSLPQAVSLGEDFGFSLDYAPLHPVLLSGGIFYRTAAEVFDSRLKLRRPSSSLKRPSVQLAIPQVDSMVTLALHEEFFNEAFRSLLHTQQMSVVIEHIDDWAVGVTYGYTYAAWPRLKFGIPSVERVMAMADIDGVPVVRIRNDLTLYLRFKLNFEATIFEKKMSFEGMPVSVEVHLEPEWDVLTSIRCVVKHVQLKRYKLGHDRNHRLVSDDDLSAVVMALVNAYLNSSNLSFDIPLTDYIPNDVILLRPKVGYTAEALLLQTDVKFNFKRPFAAAAAESQGTNFAVGRVRI